MVYKIKEIEGVGPAYAEKLGAVRITTTDELLENCCDPSGRKRIEGESGLSGKLLLKWANLADLMRISGIGPQYSELLEAAGVDTVKELRHRNAKNLADKMAEINAEKSLARTSPVEATVEKWVEAAKTTDPRISY